MLKLTFLKDDILSPDTGNLEKAGIIVSNPPYVRNSEKELMNKNVLDFEPHSALFVADSDPLVFYRAILKKAVKLLDPEGKSILKLMKLGRVNGHRCLNHMATADIRLIKDINGKERIIKGIKHG